MSARKAEFPIEANGKTPKSKTTIIKCKHHVGPGRKLCGAKRTIQVQDAFQVKRCVAHQKEYAAERRRARAKAKRNKAAKKGDR